MNQKEKPLRVVVAGLGNMGRSHALAYHENPGFEIAALVNRSDVPLPGGLAGHEIRKETFAYVVRATKPDVAAIATYSDSHADYAVAALEAGCHVFVGEAAGNDRGRRAPRGRCGQGQRQEAGRRATYCATTRPGCG